MFHPDPIVRRLHACVLAGVPALLWGAPGTGKTSRVAAYTKARAGHYERWIASRCEAIDAKPRVYHEGRVVVCETPEMQRALAAVDEGRLSVVFLDEFNRATRETEGAFLDIIDSAALRGISIIVACNPPSRGQAARNLESATANRFWHGDVAADPIAWANARIGGWETSDLSSVAIDKARADVFNAKAATLVSSFIRRQPEALEKEPENPVQAGRAWPSMRTWENAEKLFSVAMALALDTEDTRALLAGCVGDGAAVEFLAYCADMDLADPEDLLRDAAKYAPQRGRADRTVAALTAVAGAVERDFTDARWKAAWAIVTRCVDADQSGAAMVGGDLIVAGWKRLCKKDPAAGKALTPPHKLMPTRMAKILAGTP